MNLLSKEIDRQIEKCKKARDSAKNKLKNATNRTLIIIYSHGHPQYMFHEFKSKERKYIKKKNFAVLAPIANKTYSEKVLKAAEAMLKVLERCRKSLQKAGALEKTLPYEAVWDRWPDELKSITKMHAISFEEMARLFENREYTRLSLPIANTHKTLKGEYVRSKSELIIANALFQKGIPYHYEEKLGLKKKDVYPDFTILSPRTGTLVYWEHLGMLDDADYQSEAVEKLLDYMESKHWIGRDLFITYESRSRPFHNEQIDDIIENYLTAD